MNNLETIGLNIKWYRYQRRLTQENLAKKIQFKIAFVSSIENGKANVTISTVESIANGLNVKLIDLLNEETANQAKKLPNRLIALMG